MPEREESFRAGQRVQVAIESVAFGGRGVGRIGGRVVFVPFTVDGDAVEVEIVQVRRNYLAAEVTRILVASPHRVDPLCPLYGRCGGCHYQHMSYDQELRAKERQVRDAFERIGSFTAPSVRPIVPSPLSYGYRQKAEFHRSLDGNGRPVTGFKGIDGVTLIDIPRCDILHESINAELRNIRSLPADEAGSGRVTCWSGIPAGRAGHITRRVGDRDMVTPAAGFFQANAFLVETLAAAVGDACRRSPEGAFLDCFCGSGLFSLFAARQDQAVIGIDRDSESVRCAGINLSRHGFTRVHLHRGSLERILKRLSGTAPASIATVVLDPPRTGAAASMEPLAALDPDVIVYVSCNPATQARDVRLLADRGYRLNEILPLDMFPRTKHVETVAVITKTSAAAECEGAGGASRQSGIEREGAFHDG